MSYTMSGAAPRLYLDISVFVDFQILTPSGHETLHSYEPMLCAAMLLCMQAVASCAA